MFTLNNKKLQELFTCAVIASVQAGAAIMEVFSSDDYEITMKSDNSPLTLADKLAHKEIHKHLSPSRIPILSEEGRDILYEERKSWDIFWLIDPLDGTRQFIKKHYSFTVNIALIIDDYPIFGVIYVPASNTLYFGHSQKGSYKIEGINLANLNNIPNFNELAQKAIKLPCCTDKKNYSVLTSPNHTTQSTLVYIEELRKNHPDLDIKSIGSSLKLCILAEGNADLYIRHTDTYEWDTAAGQAILEGAGYSIRSIDDNVRFAYNKESLVNPWFICDKNADEKAPVI